MIWWIIGIVAAFMFGLFAGGWIFGKILARSLIEDKPGDQLVRLVRLALSKADQRKGR